MLTKLPRRILPAVLTAAAGVWSLAPALTAQEVVWDRNRPDLIGPSGILDEVTLETGEILFQYRLNFMDFEGHLVNGTDIPLQTLLSAFPTAPTSRSMQEHSVEVLYAPRPWLTLSARLPVVFSQMEEVSPTEEALIVFESESFGLGDLQLSGLVPVFDHGPYRLHAGLGVSIPIGSTDQEDVTAWSGPQGSVLTYAMQPGSGTLDVIPSATFRAINEYGVFGLQGRGVIRAGRNDRGYSHGNRVEINGWGAYGFTEMLSGTMGVRYARWQNVDGVDEELGVEPVFSATPSNNTLSQGGSRVDLPIGINVRLPSGLLAGHRFSAELVVPVHHDLEGPQLGADLGVTFSWSKILER